MIRNSLLGVILACLITVLGLAKIGAAETNAQNSVDNVVTKTTGSNPSVNAEIRSTKTPLHGLVVRPQVSCTDIENACGGSIASQDTSQPLSLIEDSIKRHSKFLDYFSVALSVLAAFVGIIVVFLGINVFIGRRNIKDAAEELNVLRSMKEEFKGSVEEFFNRQKVGFEEKLANLERQYVSKFEYEAGKVALQKQIYSSTPNEDRIYELMTTLLSGQREDDKLDVLFELCKEKFPGNSYIQSAVTRLKDRQG